ncbi:unnamed protein product [Rotaria sp. Silwood1]|nr:unnamed protein product [Rotaria sp. Silwood1]
MANFFNVPLKFNTNSIPINAKTIPLCFDFTSGSDIVLYIIKVRALTNIYSNRCSTALLSSSLDIAIGFHHNNIKIVSMRNIYEFTDHFSNV